MTAARPPKRTPTTGTSRGAQLASLDINQDEVRLDAPGARVIRNLTGQKTGSEREEWADQLPGNLPPHDDSACGSRNRNRSRWRSRLRQALDPRRNASR